MQADRMTMRCAACGHRPERVTQIADFGTTDLRFIVRCHGRTEEIRLTGHEIDLGQFGHFAARLGDLFPYDGHPDMIELLKYNRDPWRLDLNARK